MQASFLRIEVLMNKKKLPAFSLWIYYADSADYDRISWGICSDVSGA